MWLQSWALIPFHIPPPIFAATKVSCKNKSWVLTLFSVGYGWVWGLTKSIPDSGNGSTLLCGNGEAKGDKEHWPFPLTILWHCPPPQKKNFIQRGFGPTLVKIYFKIYGGRWVNSKRVVRILKLWATNQKTTSSAILEGGVLLSGGIGESVSTISEEALLPFTHFQVQVSMQNVHVHPQ